jgi:hypothetical protein
MRHLHLKNISKLLVNSEAALWLVLLSAQHNYTTVNVKGETHQQSNKVERN